MSTWQRRWAIRKKWCVVRQTRLSSPLSADKVRRRRNRLIPCMTLSGQTTKDLRLFFNMLRHLHQNSVPGSKPIHNSAHTSERSRRREQNASKSWKSSSSFWKLRKTHFRTHYRLVSRPQTTDSRKNLPFCGERDSWPSTQGSIERYVRQKHRGMGSDLIFYGRIHLQSTNLHKLCGSSRKVYMWKSWRNYKDSRGPIPLFLSTSPSSEASAELEKRRHWKKNGDVNDEGEKPCKQ